MRRTNYKLSASIICADFLHLEKQIEQLEKGKIDSVHFDFMDGNFVRRYGLFPELITQIRKICATPIDAHMMVEDAEVYLPVFLKAGLNKKEDIYTVHIESTRHIDRVLRKIKEHGIKAGVAINPGTPLCVLDYLSPLMDLVLIMGVNPGTVGQSLIPGTISKIRELKEKLKDYPEIVIEVDGGVTPQSSPEMLKAGASMLVCGSQTIFRPQEGTINTLINQLRKKLDAKR